MTEIKNINDRKDMYACFDVGGTAIKYGLADAGGRFADKGQTDTQAQLVKGAGIVEKVCAAVRRYIDEGYAVKGVAISTAGIVDFAKGSIVYAFPQVLPGYTGTMWKQLIEDRFQLACAVENDVNCAALGELWLGAGRGRKSLFAITVGTSIGGCAVEGGRIIHGAGMSAGEIACMRVPGGTLQELATATRLVRDTAAAKGMKEGMLNGKQVFEWAKQGDADAERAAASLVEHLSDGIVNIIAVLNPECVILGGGIMAQSEYLKPRIEAALDQKLPLKMREHTQIAFAELGNDAGMLGALYNLLHEGKADS